MSILIKGMEMPKNCGTCPLRRGDCLQRIYMEKRPDNCPLVPVPEALTQNAVDLIYYMPQAVNMLAERLSKALEKWILYGDAVNNAPTIIPAEEGG